MRFDSPLRVFTDSAASAKSCAELLRRFTMFSKNHFFQILRKNWCSIALFEFLFHVLIIGALLPLFQRLVSASLKWFHYSYITPNNILRYLFDWRVLLLFGGLGVVVLLALLLEMSCLFACFRYGDFDQKIPLAHMLWLGIQKSRHMLQQYHFFVLFWLIFLLPLMNLHLLFLWNQPVVLYLAEKIYRTAPHWLLGGVFLFFLFMGIISCIWTPTALLEKRGRIAWKRVGSRLKKQWWKILFFILLLNGALCFLLFLLYVLLAFGGIVVMKFFFDNERLLATALNYSHTLFYIMIYLAGALDILFNSALLYCLSVREFHNQILFHFSRPISYLYSSRSRKRMNLVTVVSYLTVALIFLNSMGKSSLFISEVVNPIFVTAHRGSSSEAPENTLESLQQAIDYTADFAEIDVQETFDGVVILLHDANLKRTTGVNQYVYNLTYDKVRQLDAGKWFSDEYVGTFIPTLAEALQLCNGKINLNIEIKDDAHNSDLPAKVVNLIEEYDFVEQCVVTSTNYNYLKQVKEQNPDITTGYILKMSMGNIASLEYADFFSMKYSYVTKQMVDQIHIAGKGVHVWTVNSSNGINRMKSLGVDNIITDNVVLAKKLLARNDGKESWSELFYLFLKQERGSL